MVSRGRYSIIRVRQRLSRSDLKSWPTQEAFMVGTAQPNNTPASWDRRTFLKASGITIGGLSLASLVAACGGAGGGGASGGTLTLRLPFLADMQVPDPDITYEGEGAQVMEFAYEGLVRYKPGSPEIIGGLAESWTISDDHGPTHSRYSPV